jgi:superoxide dismutase, Cu-Zn family
MAVAVIQTKQIHGEILAFPFKHGIKLHAHFTKLPKGKHGFHIHRAGDLRGEGCQGLCEHYDIGKNQHGDSPFSKEERHTGDLGNIEIKANEKEFKETYYLSNVSAKDLWGRSIIVHQDEDDLGKGSFEDSKTTGHSGKRIGCAIFGRLSCSSLRQTRKKLR